MGAPAFFARAQRATSGTLTSTADRPHDLIEKRAQTRRLSESVRVNAGLWGQSGTVGRWGSASAARYSVVTEIARYPTSESRAVACSPAVPLKPCSWASPPGRRMTFKLEAEEQRAGGQEAPYRCGTRPSKLPISFKQVRPSMAEPVCDLCYRRGQGGSHWARSSARGCPRVQLQPHRAQSRSRRPNGPIIL
jgi:hypothetical protein